MGQMGPQPLDLVALDIYAQRYDIRDFDLFLEVMGALDSIWIEVVMNRRKSYEEKVQAAQQREAQRQKAQLQNQAKVPQLGQ